MTLPEPAAVPPMRLLVAPPKRMTPANRVPTPCAAFRGHADEVSLDEIAARSRPGEIDMP